MEHKHTTIVFGLQYTGLSISWFEKYCALFYFLLNQTLFVLENS